MGVVQTIQIQGPVTECDNCASLGAFLDPMWALEQVVKVLMLGDPIDLEVTYRMFQLGSCSAPVTTYGLSSWKHKIYMRKPNCLQQTADLEPDPLAYIRAAREKHQVAGHDKGKGTIST